MDDGKVSWTTGLRDDRLPRDTNVVQRTDCEGQCCSWQVYSCRCSIGISACTVDVSPSFDPQFSLRDRITRDTSTSTVTIWPWMLSIRYGALSSYMIGFFEL